MCLNLEVILQQQLIVNWDGFVCIHSMINCLTNEGLEGVMQKIKTKQLPWSLGIKFHNLETDDDNQKFQEFGWCGWIILLLASLCCESVCLIPAIISNSSKY